MFWSRRSELDLVGRITWVSGYPFENGHAITVRGYLCDFPFRPAAPSAHLLFEDGGGTFYPSSSNENRDDDGDLVAGGSVYRRDGEFVFDTLISGEAVRRIRPARPLVIKIAIVNDGQVISRSRFRLERGARFVQQGHPVMLDAIAWHMNNVATLGGRELETGDLREMVRSATDYLSLSPAGRDDLKRLVKENRNQRIHLWQIPEYHDRLFEPGWRVDRTVEQFICAMVGREIERRPEFQTEAHALLLDALVSDRIDEGLRSGLGEIADRILGTGRHADADLVRC